MLVAVVGMLLTGSLGMGPAPHRLDREDVCLLRTPCDRPPVFCLVDRGDCDSGVEPPVCFVDGCAEPRGPG